MRIDPETGFHDKETLDSQNLKVFAACLLNSGVQGQTLTIDEGAEAPTGETLLLGCARGYILKFEKAAGETEWTKTGESRVD